MTDYYKICYVLLMVFFTILTLKEFFVQSESKIPEKEIPVTRVGFNQYSGPKLKFQYCFSCGYHKAFLEYGNIIRQKYPNINIEGENYNPPAYIMLFAKLVGAVKMLFIVCILTSVNIFQYIGQPQPSWWAWCVENKLYSCLMIFFTCNAVESHLVSTGAFEIAFNDVPVWSKLETGRIPQPAELFQIIDSNLQFQGMIELKPGFTK